jgi:acetyl esterase
MKKRRVYMANRERIELEKDALAFVIEQEEPPYLYELPVEEGRKTVDEAQKHPAKKLSATIEKIEGITTPTGTVSVTLYKPETDDTNLTPVVYAHGGGWVFGNDHTHDRLMRELAVEGHTAVFFVNYSLSPEAKYPTALHEVFAVTKWVAENAAELGVNKEALIVAGDSAGGNMATATTLLAKEYGSPKIAKQVLLYPVTDASFDTPSYEQFARGYFLHKDGMKWFWDQYTSSDEQRNEITATPLKATLDDLKGLPEALVITGEADVLRDEGEQYAEKLKQAGVAVTHKRYDKIVHDFLMLNVLAETNAKKEAIELIAKFLK